MGVGVGDSQGNELEDVGVGVGVDVGLGPANPIQSNDDEQGPPITGNCEIQLVETVFGLELQTVIPVDNKYVSLCEFP